MSANTSGAGERPILIATCYALPWSRYINAEHWMKAEIVARKTAPDGQVTSWAIQEGGAVLAKDGMWEFEPSPSNRDEDFFERTRFASLAEATAFAAEHFAKETAR